MYKKQISSHPQKLNNILRNNCEEELTWPYHCYFCLQSFAGGHFPLLDPTIDRSIKYDTQIQQEHLRYLIQKLLCNNKWNAWHYFDSALIVNWVLVLGCVLCFTSEVSAERAKCQSCIRIHSHFLHDHTWFLWLGFVLLFLKEGFPFEKIAIIPIICLWTRRQLLIELGVCEDRHHEREMAWMTPAVV